MANVTTPLAKFKFLQFFAENIISSLHYHHFHVKNFPHSDFATGSTVLDHIEKTEFYPQNVAKIWTIEQ